MIQAYSLTVDDVSYRVHVIFPTLVNSFEIMEGPNSGTAQTGREIRDIIGTRYDYEMDVEPDARYPQDFDALFEVLSAPVESHRVNLPYGQSELSFDAAVSEGSRTWHGFTAGYERWKGLKIKFRALKPQRAVDA